MSKNTPGPWAVEEYGDGRLEVVGTGDLNGVTLAAVRGRPHKETTRANAVLMSLAPELLETLTQLKCDVGVHVNELHNSGGMYPTALQGMALAITREFDRAVQLIEKLNS